MTLENSINSLRHLFFLLIFYSLISCGYYSKEFSGSTFGTYYKIKYFSDEKVYVNQKEIDSVFTVFNNSLSTYINDSKISKINSGLDIELDDLFIDVFNKSKIIYEKTNGMFDPSIGLLLEYYGFGPNKKWMHEAMDAFCALTPAQNLLRTAIVTARTSDWAWETNTIASPTPSGNRTTRRTSLRCG